MPSAIAKRTLRTMSLGSVLGYGTWFFLIEEQLYYRRDRHGGAVYVRPGGAAPLRRRPAYSRLQLAGRRHPRDGGGRRPPDHRPVAHALPLSAPRGVPGGAPGHG